MRPAQQVEVYPDGVVDIYEESNRKIYKKKASLRFEKQSVGVNRFYQAQAGVSGSRVDKTIKVPHTSLIKRLDIAVVRSEDAQYRINRIQEKPERKVDILELQSVQVTIEKGEAN